MVFRGRADDAENTRGGCIGGHKFMKREILIKIQVCGLAGNGKTCIAEKIGKVLQEEGFNVKLIDDFDSGYTAEDVRQRLKAIAPETDVIVEAVQLRRSFLPS